jgi:hypothetical protein
VGIRYSESKREFTTLGCGGPVNVISEDEYGYPQNGTLVYPNVNSCTTITVMLDNNEVFGTHLTVASPTSLVETILNKINDSRGARSVTQLHVVGVLKASGSGWKSSAEYFRPKPLPNAERDLWTSKNHPDLCSRAGIQANGCRLFPLQSDLWARGTRVVLEEHAKTISESGSIDIGRIQTATTSSGLG